MPFFYPDRYLHLPNECPLLLACHCRDEPGKLAQQGAGALGNQDSRRRWGRLRELALKLLALPELVLAPNVAQFVHLFQAVKLCSQRSDHNLVWSNGFLQPVPGNG